MTKLRRFYYAIGMPVIRGITRLVTSTYRYVRRPTGTSTMCCVRVLSETG